MYFKGLGAIINFETPAYRYAYRGFCILAPVNLSNSPLNVKRTRQRFFKAFS